MGPGRPDPIGGCKGVHRGHTSPVRMKKRRDNTGENGKKEGSIRENAYN